MKTAIRFFFQGLLFVVPVMVTIWVLIKTILWVDSLLPFQIHIRVPGLNELDIPGLGLITIFVVVSAIGYISVKYIRNPFFSYVEMIIVKAPPVKLIYGSVKDLVVRLERNSDINRVGFITQEDLSDIGIEKEMVAVYLPFSYSFAGELIILPRENIRPLDASGTDMMKFIISGGVTEIKE